MPDNVVVSTEAGSSHGNTGSLISSCYLDMDYLLNRVENATNYYQTLGVNRTATQEQIAEAFEAAVIVLQPPHKKVRDALYEQMSARIGEAFAKVSAAFDTLANVDRRAEYDRGTLNKRAYVRLQPMDVNWSKPNDQVQEPAPVAETKTEEPVVEADNSQTTDIRVFYEQERAYVKASKEAGASTRRCERFKLGIPALLTAYDADGSKWKEVTKTIDVSRVGAAVRMSRRVKYGLIVHLILPLPTRLRSHGFTEPSYSTYAIVRRIQPPNEGLRVIGLEFLGAAPPTDYLKKRWGTFRTQKWVGPDRRTEPRFKIAERVEVEYLNASQELLSSEKGITENLSASGVRVRVSQPPPDFDWIRVKSQKRNFESLALLRNQYVGKDNVERICVQFVENKWTHLPVPKEPLPEVPQPE